MVKLMCHKIVRKMTRWPSFEGCFFRSKDHFQQFYGFCMLEVFNQEGRENRHGFLTGGTEQAANGNSVFSTSYVNSISPVIAMTIKPNHAFTTGAPIKRRELVFLPKTGILFQTNFKVMINDHKNHPGAFCKNYSKMSGHRKHYLTGLI